MNAIITLLDNSVRIIDAATVATVERDLGDAQPVYERCGKVAMPTIDDSGFRIVFVDIYCPDCEKKGRVSHCEKYFVAGVVKSPPEPIHITFKDGTAWLAKEYEIDRGQPGCTCGDCECGQ